MLNRTNRALAVPPMRLVGNIATVLRRQVLAKHYAHLVATDAPERLNPIWGIFSGNSTTNFVK